MLPDLPIRETWHVMPAGDKRPHIAHPGCACQPTLEDPETNLYLHYSWDGREFFEKEFEEPKRFHN